MDKDLNVLLNTYKEMPDVVPLKLFDWLSISRNKNLTNEFIEVFIDQLEIGCILENYKLPIKFLEKNFDKLNIIATAQYQDLTEEFIEKHLDQLPMHIILQNQVLSEEFIERILDVLDEDSEYVKSNYMKSAISSRKSLSIEFLYKHRNELDLGTYARHNCISLEYLWEQLDEYEDQLTIDNIDTNKNKMYINIDTDNNTIIIVNFVDYPSLERVFDLLLSTLPDLEDYHITITNSPELMNSDYYYMVLNLLFLKKAISKNKNITLLIPSEQEKIFDRVAEEYSIRADSYTLGYSYKTI